MSDISQALLVSHLGAKVLVRTPTGENIQCQVRQSARDLVTGDQVMVEGLKTSEPVICGRMERSSELFRTDMRSRKKLVAANLDSIAIVIAPVPEPHLGLIDRYLVAAELAEIEAMILINKQDLGFSSCLDEVRRIYPALGYKVISVAAKSGAGIENLSSALKGRHLALLGQSGVGKSSLINVLISVDSARVGDLSSKRSKGRHTTTASHIYGLEEKGWLMDSPGIREFENKAIERSEIIRGFPEIAAQAQYCEFRNCAHLSDRGCAVQAALSGGKIEKTRYQNYQMLVAEAMT